jgi:2-keto-4-pentenoate hydratase/2-oxohepta-3-ene-1,7-dioic acid hydratase in catechol pathway
MGINPSDGTAELIEGDLFGKWKPLGRRAEIRALLTPVTPPNVFAIGLNYQEHARLMGADIPEYPVVFMKPTTTLANPGSPILLPKCSRNRLEVDYECELAIVIGRSARDVPSNEALEYVFGYTAANDVTARKWVKASRTRGKGFDSFCPLGPMLVSADEIPDPQGLALHTTLNGNVVQQGNTADMIFSVADLVSYISQDTTLLPGTVILTGTPPGSGVTREPPVYLKADDQVQVEVERIGTLSNPVGYEGDHVKDVA